MDDGIETIRQRATILPSLLASCACAVLAPHLALASCVRPATAPPLCVVGTITAKGNSAALVETQGVAGSDWLHAGDATGGWTIVEIGAGYVLVKNKDRSVRLEPDGVADVVAAPSSATPVAETHVTERAAVKRGPLISSQARQRRGEHEDID